MRLAWLRPAAAARPPDPLDPGAQLIDSLRVEYDIDVIDAARAHDLVWRHAREPFDLFVHEMDDTPAHAYVAAYAVHYPGILLLRGFAPQHARAVQASRTVVVGDEAIVESLAEHYPAATVIAAPVGLGSAADAPSRPIAGGAGDRATVFGILEARPRSGEVDLKVPRWHHVVERAAARAREAGSRVETMSGPAATVLDRADVIVALDWPPPAGPPIAALAGMAAGKAVVVLETLVTAGWPSLDPQTWTARGFGSASTAEPVVISIDPRDEEHSLMLALKRLATDAALCASLGDAARAWWRGHATIAHAIEAWRRILSEPGLPPSPGFAGVDGTDHARGVLAEFGVRVDFL